MAIINVNCPDCGDLKLSPQQLQIQVCSANEGSTYSFLCPGCRLIVNKGAEQRVVELLVSAGVRVVSWDLPAELSEPHYGPAISYDDLLTFHFELESEDWRSKI
jgi:hypothetical protein